MNVLLRVFAGLLLLSSLWGCLDLETTIRVKPDGSGTLESKVLMNPKVSPLMQDTAKESNRPLDLLDEEKLKRDAEKMGTGVRFLSAERLTSKEGHGYRALYAFDDINALKIRQNPDEPSLPEAGSEEKSLAEKITFSFRKGSPSTLTIRMPKAKEKPQPQKNGESAQQPGPKEEEDISKDSVEMVKSMFQGLRMVLALEIQGSVLATNATYREGSRITLMEMDFDQLTSNPEQFQSLVKARPQHPAEIADLLRAFPGIKAEMRETVTVEFR